MTIQANQKHFWLHKDPEGPENQNIISKSRTEPILNVGENAAMLSLEGKLDDDRFVFVNSVAQNMLPDEVVRLVGYGKKVEVLLTAEYRVKDLSEPITEPIEGERFLFFSIFLIISTDIITKRLRVTKMKQKYHKKYKIQQMPFSVASYCFSIMWQSLQMMMLLKCHMRNDFASFIRCKDTNFSRHTIKTLQLSAHIYYIGLGASQPRGPNIRVQNGL